MHIIPGWYAVLEASELKASRPLAFKRFGIDLVGWRTCRGEAVIILDLCPHRRARLSGGKLTQDQITCPFHGFQFDKKGSCVHVPETGKPAENLKVQSFLTAESHGFIWLYYSLDSAGRGPTGQPPWFDGLDHLTRYSLLAEQWPTHISRCIENQLDYAHLPFVHATTIGARFNPASKVSFDLKDSAIKFLPNSASSAFIELLLPNVWRNFISRNFQLVLAFAPVSEAETRLYLRSYSPLIGLPLAGALAGILFSQLNRIILNQDRKVVLSQFPQNSLSMSSQDERLFLSDAAVVHYRKLSAPWVCQDGPRPWPALQSEL
jgi:phenylpropionate dioxygenase-like ring-hydroxylating dioxygenase large terminal subunit